MDLIFSLEVKGNKETSENTGDKEPESLHKSVSRNTRFLKILLNEREVCGRHTTVHILPRYLDIISSKLN